MTALPKLQDACRVCEQRPLASHSARRREVSQLVAERPMESRQRALQSARAGVH
jgi:hypothetical protein